MANVHLHESDFYAWANEQADLLRRRRLDEADIDHIADEIETMGKTERRELISRLEVLLTHLLKWRFQPVGRSRSWRLTIEEQRRKVVDHLGDNPSLRHRMDEALASAYAGALLVTARETLLELETFPAECPWCFAEVVDSAFWPEEPRD